MKTLVIVSHPYPQQSNTIKALQKIAENTSDIVVRNLDVLYGNDINDFDIKTEQLAHEQADRIVYMFPIHWFNLTPMLKAYMNEVWAYGWAFGPDGNALKDKEFQVVVTAGATEFTYSKEGIIKTTMDEVLSPLKASAYYVGMKYNQPLAFFSARGASGESLAKIESELSARLRSPFDTVPALN